MTQKVRRWIWFKIKLASICISFSVGSDFVPEYNRTLCNWDSFGNRFKIARYTFDYIEKTLLSYGNKHGWLSFLEL